MTILSDEQLKKQDEWKKIILDLDQRLHFAKKAVLLKWRPTDAFVQCSQRLLRARSDDERTNDLWATYKTIQSNLIKGGVRFYTITDLITDLGNSRSFYQNHITRPMKSENKIAWVNKNLWSIATKIADIAKISE
jgi:hypothetical protein